MLFKNIRYWLKVRVALWKLLGFSSLKYFVSLVPRNFGFPYHSSVSARLIFGYKIKVTTGCVELLSENQLISILAHEAGHIEMRQLEYGISFFTPADELELEILADLKAVEMMAAIDIPKENLITALRKTWHANGMREIPGSIAIRIDEILDHDVGEIR